MIRKICLFVLSLFLVFGVFGTSVSAQSTPVTFELNPATGSFAPGAHLNIGINIDTGGLSVQAAQAVIKYDPDLMEATTVTYGDIIPSTEKELLAGQETIDNSAGYVVVPAAWLMGYTGAGEMASVAFNVKSPGTAVLTFEDVNQDRDYNAAFETDGDGQTNVLGAMTGSTYTFSSGGSSGNTNGTYTGNTLPETGVMGGSLAIMGLILLLSSGVMYFKFKNQQDRTVVWLELD